MLALKEKYEKDVEFIVADTGDSANAPLAGQFNIYYIPHIIIMDGTGNVLFSEAGPQTVNTMESYLNQAIETK